ncbi:GNAT family N-acetyltransferase [Cellulomonas gelida]|uniref:N-acetyltransferase n=1 Tax=Cellulomonas gelida TaxID=1712 RepID=A0A4Y3KMA6_9CELL|nr:GNAT family N-acetyltransferase [Cellulomonas gelida]GEA84514.1 N-acetyltransferase [Cellulomonas gelida]GGL38338.1 N-acetyltransferase [Cellulomonas gelida]
MLIPRPFDSEALKLHPFTCGEPELDNWLAEHAGQNERRNNVRTTLLLDEHKGRIAGYYSLRTFELSAADGSSAIGRTRRYPIPAMLMARLAVDVGYQGAGVGRILLFDALHKLASAAEDVGFEIVVVHALHENAACFYLKYGFRRFLDHELSLFMTTKELRATFVTSESS